MRHKHRDYGEHEYRREGRPKHKIVGLKLDQNSPRESELAGSDIVDTA